MGAFRLLTRGNPKTLKGEKQGYLTFILHLAPGSQSGFQVCPMATQGCLAACLNVSGHGGIPSPVVVDGESFLNSVQAARVRKTRRLFRERAAFMADLVRDITRAIGQAKRKGFTPVFRLNGTSDIRWERIPVDGFRNIMERFPTVQFYDYTKIANRRDLPGNYHLTFSLAESNRGQAEQALQMDMNVAAVFRTKGQLPESFMGRAVFNGDDSDLRFRDPRGVVVGLYAKGRAKRDTSGFVQN